MSAQRIPAGSPRIQAATREYEREYEERKAREIAHERQLSARARTLAAELVMIADELQWGDGTASGCAQDFLSRAAEEAGIPWSSYRFTDMSVSARSIFARDGWECQRCGSHRDLTIDHKIARANGGTDEPGNLQTLCMMCNSRKGASA